MVFSWSNITYVALDEQRKDIKINQNALIKQIEEFELQRVELSETREIFKEQSITLKIQRFENTFFQLINLYNEIISNLQITYNNESYEKRDVFAFGLNNLSNIFSVYLKEYKQNKFGDWYIANEIQLSEAIEVEPHINSAYKNFIITLQVKNLVTILEPSIIFLNLYINRIY